MATVGFRYNRAEKLRKTKRRLKMPSQFDPLKFVQDGYETALGEYSQETRCEIKAIRSAHTELSEWGDLAVGAAWGDYSQDELEVSWCYWLIGKRDEQFLSYIENK